MPPAARIGDRCVHIGAKLATGSPDTIVDGKELSRVGDISLGCELPPGPHKVGRLVKCSRTVFINGLAAARKGDGLVCPSPPPTPGAPGGPRYAVKRWEVIDEKNHGELLYADGQLTDRDGDGTKDTAEGSIGGLQQVWGGENWDARVGVLTANGQISMSQGAVGMGTSGSVEASVLSGEVGGKAQLAGSNENPLEVGGSLKGSLLSASADFDYLMGSDGRRIGISTRGQAGVALAEGSATGNIAIPIPFTSWSIELDATGSASAGPPGVGLGAGLFYDTQEDRLHATALFSIKWLGLDLDLSIGKKAGVATVAPSMDSVAEGCMTVFIGG